MNRRSLFAMALAWASMSFAAPALAQGGSSQSGSSQGGSAQGGAGGGAAPSDPQIAAIAVAANQVDIDAAKVAKSRAKSADVKEFANTMIRDHEGVLKQAKALVQKLHVKPEENPTSRSLEEGGKKNVAHLKKLKGPEFDKAYAEHEVAYHQQVLDALDNTLIPNAKNPELKSLLEKVKPAIQAHLDHAKKLESELAGSAGPSK